MHWQAVTALASTQQFPHFSAEPLRLFRLRGFGDDADDRLGVARPDVGPAVGPVEAEADEPVGLRLRPALFQRRPK